MSFPAYPQYKDSGIETLGVIPDHWDVTRLPYIVFDNNAGEVIDKNFWGDGSELLYTCAKQPLLSDYKDFPARKRTGVNDLLLTRNGTPYVHLPIQGSIYSNVVQRVSLMPGMDRNFMRAALDVATRDLVGYGVSIASFNYEMWTALRIPLPVCEEQTQIARFLDHETARIDALIEEQQRLIELLKEKRQAVISHAVTKGLDPTVPMKDSGVEWLGEVPAHWKQIRIKHILNAMIDAEHKTAEYSDDGEYLVCRTTNVRNGLLSLEGAKYADRDTYIDWTRRGVPEPLDILFTREAPAGEACLVPENLEICLGQRMVLFKLDKTRIDPAFTVHSIYAGLASDFVKQLSQGSTVSHFNMADIGNIPLFEPPLPEQKEISDFLARRCDSYDLLINEAESSVKLISERRSALISAAVTGKIDVRGWQPPASAPTPELVQEAV